MGFVDEVLDKTRVLATDELVISEGFRRELMRWLENNRIAPKTRVSQ